MLPEHTANRDFSEPSAGKFQRTAGQTQLAVAQQARAMSLVTLYKVLGGGAVDLENTSEDKTAQTAEVKSEA